jgi:predicted RNA-binding protein YlxR (DUF448 family)/ribosomal protein L7Ae-like RNA K-turn-binding protein
VQMQMKGKDEPQQRRPPRATPTRVATGKRSLRLPPVRTCIGCRQQGSPLDLVRMVLMPDGGVAFDLAGGAMGRGAWVHPTELCLPKAAKVTLRHLHVDAKGAPLADDHSVPGLGNSISVEALMLTLAGAAMRRSVGLIGAACRARHVALGGDAANDAFSEGKARLVILATDARAVKQQSWIEAATAKGIVVGWATKAELGAMVGRDELAVIVVTDEGLAQNLLRVMAMTRPVTSRLAKANRDATAAAVSARTIGSQGRQDSEDG